MWLPTSYSFCLITNTNIDSNQFLDSIHRDTKTKQQTKQKQNKTKQNKIKQNQTNKKQTKTKPEHAHIEEVP